MPDKQGFQPHPTTWVKVNVQVDLLAAPIVAALSEIPKLETFSSCQDNEPMPVEVWFWYGDGDEQSRKWQDLAEFAFGHLAPHLFKTVGDSARVAVWWCTTWNQAYATLRIDRTVVEKVAESIRQLRLESGSP